MIFVTVGTHEQPFNRLLEEIDNLVENKKIKEKIIAQIGYSTYSPKNFEYFKFTSFEKINSLINSASLIITHGGIASIFLALKKRKKVIAVPRMKKFNEHSDNHQVQIVRELEKQKMIIAVYDIKDLEKAIKKSRYFSFKYIRKKSIIAEKISKTLREWEKQFNYL